MIATLVDTNVLLDVFTKDPRWSAWSLSQMEAATVAGGLAINDVIYAELSVGFNTVEALDRVLDEGRITLVALPRAALFLAGRAFRTYRRAGGMRTGVLPDFFIGAHAAVTDLPILTRDPTRYRTYFPKVILVTPRSD